MNDSLGASAAKVATVTTGAALSGMDSVTQAIGTHGQDIIWWLTASYAVLQLYKSVPWCVMQTIAIYKGIRYRNWSAFKAIAKREDRSDEDGNS